MRRGIGAVLLAALLSLCVADVRGVYAKTLALVLDAAPNRANEAQAIAAQLNQVGVNAQVRVWQTSVLQPQIISDQRAAYMTDWGSAYFDPFDLAVPKLVTGGRGNYSFYANPGVDKSLKIASTTANDAVRYTPRP